MAKANTKATAKPKAKAKAQTAWAKAKADGGGRDGCACVVTCNCTGEWHRVVLPEEKSPQCFKVRWHWLDFFVQKG